MTKEEMISIIYEKIADKTLSFGAKIFAENKRGERYIWTFQYWTSEIDYKNPSDRKFICYQSLVNNYNERIGKLEKFGISLENLFSRENLKVKILGHPVVIGRCDLLIEKGPNYFEDWTEILDLWGKKDEPIEKQNDKCIEYIYNLISKSLGKN